MSGIFQQARPVVTPPQPAPFPAGSQVSKPRIIIIGETGRFYSRESGPHGFPKNEGRTGPLLAA
jgi:hypothetical protein